ncbi:hypothetical protein [Streptacidiphilus rugosus]|uniref:hypothetical protein n=1 Tax=Streptacidiphilus rugosus TaxID=405783 RepID=UPI000569F138|nr:hypothetical protein [Streptacidiphilus rugosus]
MSDWRWEYDPDKPNVVGGLPLKVVARVERIAAELAVVASLDVPDGAAYQGAGIKIREVAEPDLMVWYSTFPRLELVCVLRVQYSG